MHPPTSCYSWQRESIKLQLSREGSTVLDVLSQTSLFYGVLNANVVPQVKLVFHFFTVTTYELTSISEN